jgi:S-(hydroxymethyl)glutathione dehydrogenase/alcohol dehydrogenase
MKTRAAVLWERDSDLVIENLELDPPRSGEVLVKLAASGVCHSDLHVISGTIGEIPPVVLGHEGAGTVMEVGAGVDSVKPGDSVILAYVSACGRCRNCSQGKPNLCTTHWRTVPRGTLLDGTCRFHKGETPIRQMLRLGTMSEHAVVAETAVIRVEPDTPLDKAALIGCGVMTGVGAVMNTAKVEPGSLVAVIGTGGVGLNVIQGASLVGAARIIAVDVAPMKLELARRFGATDTVDASVGDPVAQVLALTDGEGVDYAFEAIGSGKTVAQAFAMLRPTGTAVAIGIPAPDETVTLPLVNFPRGERRLVGSMYGSARMRVDMPRILSLYRAGKLKLDELVTRTYTLNQANDALADLREGRNARGVILFDR